MQLDVMTGLMSYGVFVFSTSFHEASHAWTALKLGDDTAHRGGQVTLDPIPHIRREPMGMVVVPLLSWFFNGTMIGWASAPFNPLWARAWPRRNALMSAAGPAANFILVLVAGILLRVGLHFGVFQLSDEIGWYQLAVAEEGVWSAVVSLLSVLFNLNLLLALFNLIPLPPLDGGSVLLLFLPERAAQRMMDFLHQPTWSILGLLVAWKLFGHVFWPAWSVGVRILFAGL